MTFFRASHTVRSLPCPARQFSGFGKALRCGYEAADTIPYSAYFEADVNGTAGGDSGDINSGNNLISTTEGTTRVAFAATSAHLIGWEIGPFAGIRSRLANAGLDNLTNSGAPFGPGDFTSAFQWQAPLNAGEDAFGRLAILANTAIPEPATIFAIATGLGLLTARRRRK